MSEITKYNFDEWLFDYFEGSLSAADQQLLKNFVAKNADFQKEFALWQKTYVAKDNVEVPENIEASFTKPSDSKSSSRRIIFIALLFIVLAALVLLFFNIKKGEKKIPLENKVSTVKNTVQEVIETETKDENPQNGTANKTTFKGPVVENTSVTSMALMKKIPDSLMQHKSIFLQAPHNMWAVNVLDSLELQNDSSLHHKVYPDIFDPRLVELEQRMSAVADSWIFKAGLFVLKNIMNGNIKLNNGNSTKSSDGSSTSPPNHGQNRTR